VRWIDAYSSNLAELKETILAGDAEKLEQVFDEALIARHKWLKAREEGSWEETSAEMPTMAGFMGQLFGLSRLTKRRKQG
jgi:hypothetical protein